MPAHARSTAGAAAPAVSLLGDTMWVRGHVDAQSSVPARAVIDLQRIVRFVRVSEAAWSRAYARRGSRSPRARAGRSAAREAGAASSVALHRVDGCVSSVCAASPAALGGHPPHKHPAMSRGQPLLAFVSLMPLLQAAAYAATNDAAAARPPRPNVLFLVVESTDGRTWAPGYSGGALALPAIRELQATGFEFRRHYANAPVCCPSRATFWSGRHASNIPHRHGAISVGGVYNNYEGLPSDYNDRVDQVLERAGYNVGVFGKRDWDTAGHGESAQHTDLALWTMQVAFPYNTSNGGWASEVTGGGCASNGTVTPGGSPGANGSAHNTDWKTTATTTAWLANASASATQTPWFAYAGMNIVHPPYVTSQFWYDSIDPGKVSVPEWEPLEDMHPCAFQSSMLKGCIPSAETAAAFYSIERRRRIRRIYLAMIAEFDAMVGTFIEAVKAADAWDNTVWIVTSDHGDMQLEHQQFYKMTPYDASASVPMVVSVPLQHLRQFGEPRHAAGAQVVSAPTQLIDIMPTVLDLAQLHEAQRPQNLDGTSLLPLMVAPAASLQALGAASARRQDSFGSRPSFVVSQFHGKNIAMSWFLVVQQVQQSNSTSTLKLIVWGNGSQVPNQLFDLDQDPHEKNNLVATPEGQLEYAATVAMLQRSILSQVDYPKVAMDVAAYNKAIFSAWIANTTNWQEVAANSSCWKTPWDEVGNTAALEALTNWLAEPPRLVPCRSGSVWPS